MCQLMIVHCNGYISGEYSEINTISFPNTDKFVSQEFFKYLHFFYLIRKEDQVLVWRWISFQRAKAGPP